MGLAFDSKYTGIFLPAGLVLFLLLSPNHRRLFASGWFWLSALVFIATGIVETLGSYVIGIITNAIYARTIEIYPGIIFFILSGICLISLIING